MIIRPHVSTLMYCDEEKDYGDEERLQEVNELLALIPEDNCHLLRELLSLLNEVLSFTLSLFYLLFFFSDSFLQTAAHSDMNCMGPHNLATVIGPGLLWPKPSNEPDHSAQQLQAIGSVIKIAQFLIESYPQLTSLQRSATVSEKEASCEQTNAEATPDCSGNGHGETASDKKETKKSEGKEICVQRTDSGQWLLWKRKRLSYLFTESPIRQSIIIDGQSKKPKFGSENFRDKVTRKRIRDHFERESAQPVDWEIGKPAGQIPDNLTEEDNNNNKAVGAEEEESKGNLQTEVPHLAQVSCVLIG